MPMCFNLFGNLSLDPEAADRAVHEWWDEASRNREPAPQKGASSTLLNRTATKFAPPMRTRVRKAVRTKPSETGLGVLGGRAWGLTSRGRVLMRRVSRHPREAHR
jgi:hypothetical protein